MLLPTDGSDGATAALDHAVGAAEAYGAALHVVSVVDRRVVLAADTDAKGSVRADLTDEATEAVERLFEVTPAPLLLMDGDGRIRRMNDRATSSSSAAPAPPGAAGAGRRDRDSLRGGQDAAEHLA